MKRTRLQMSSPSIFIQTSLSFLLYLSSLWLEIYTWCWYRNAVGNYDSSQQARIRRIYVDNTSYKLVRSHDVYFTLTLPTSKYRHQHWWFCICHVLTTSSTIRIRYFMFSVLIVPSRWFWRFPVGISNSILIYLEISIYWNMLNITSRFL